MEIIIILLSCILSFAVGGAWIQSKETRFGKKANYICNKCEATGCQSKFCEIMRKKSSND